jgi:hypothetical protein
MSGQIQRNIPQGLKPIHRYTLNGTAKAVPYQAVPYKPCHDTTLKNSQIFEFLAQCIGFGKSNRLHSDFGCAGYIFRAIVDK